MKQKYTFYSPHFKFCFIKKAHTETYIQRLWVRARAFWVAMMPVCKGFFLNVVNAQKDCKSIFFLSLFLEFRSSEGEYSCTKNFDTGLKVILNRRTYIFFELKFFITILHLKNMWISTTFYPNYWKSICLQNYLAMWVRMWVTLWQEFRSAK